MFVRIASIAVALCAAGNAVAQPPVLTHLTPAAVKPGSTVDVTLYGQQLGGLSATWTSFPADCSFTTAPNPANAQPAVGSPPKEGLPVTSANLRITVPADTPVGIGGIRVATQKGVSEVRLVMLDDLASTVESAKNQTRDAAQVIVPPIAVDGACDKEQSDYYKLHAVAGQRLSLELVARRLGFKTDAVMRLLDSTGSELAYADDDPVSGVDPRIAYRFKREGDYFVEVRDVRYEGGADYRYRLRVGEFPLPATAFPLALRRGVTTSISLSGLEGAPLSRLTTLIEPAEKRAQVRLPAKFAAGRGSSWVVLQASDVHEQMEQEPNDNPGTSTACAVPGAVQGRLQMPGDRDFYHFAAKKGQRLVLRGQARSFGSPADLYLRIYKADGSVAVEADDQGNEEGSLDFRVPADGTYRLMVEHVTGLGGPEHTYRVLIEPFQPGFALVAQADKFDAPQAGVLALKVTCQRREYNGPIELGLEGARAGYVLKDNVIAEGKAETRLTATLPASLRTGEIDTFRIVGKATAKGSTQSATATTFGLLRPKIAGLPFPPAELDGVMAVGVGPQFKPFFAIEVSPAALEVSQTSRAAIKVKATRQHGFDGTIRLAVNGLPAGVTAKAKSLEKGQSEVLIELSATSTLAAKHPVQVVGTATYNDQPGTSTGKPVDLVPGVPIELALAPSGTLAPGGKQKALLTFRGDLHDLARPATYAPGVSHAVDGPRPPEFPGLENDNRAAAFSGADKAPADDHLAAVLEGLNRSEYSLEMFVLPSRDLSLPGAPPISGYIFSRAGTSTSRGDHLGIGGMSPVAPRDKLFVYNGRDVVAGKTTLPLNAWHHLVMVRTGESVTVYLNGDIVSPEIQAPLAGGGLSDRVVLGTRADGYGPLHGKLDELSLFEIPLSPQQVKAHYDAAKVAGGYATAILKDRPVAFWRLNETEGGQAASAVAPTFNLEWKNLPAGITGPTQVALPLGQQQAEVELAAAPDAAVGKFDTVAVSAGVRIGGRQLKIDSKPAVFEIVKNP